MALDKLQYIWYNISVVKEGICMKVYVVLCDRPIGYNDYCETEIVDIFECESDADRCARDSDNYRIEEWYVSGT